jgi:hypothetical protein
LRWSNQGRPTCGCSVNSVWSPSCRSAGLGYEITGSLTKKRFLTAFTISLCQLPLFGRIAYPVPAEATKHDKPGCKSLGCPAEIFAAVGATCGASKPGDLNIKNHYANVFTGQHDTHSRDFAPARRACSVSEGKTERRTKFNSFTPTLAPQGGCLGARCPVRLVRA